VKKYFPSGVRATPMPVKLGAIKRCPMGIHEPVHFSADCL